MSATKSITLSANRDGELGGRTNLEIPISGPGRCNLLVCMSGWTLRGFETAIDFDLNRIFVEFFIDTGYVLKESDILVNSSSYATLASIKAQEPVNVEFGVLLSLDDSAVSVMENTKEVELRVSGNTQFDNALFRIGYQINLLLIRID